MFQAILNFSYFEHPPPPILMDLGLRIIFVQFLLDLLAQARGFDADKRPCFHLIGSEQFSTCRVFLWFSGGFLIPELNFMKETLRLDVLEANFFARQVGKPEQSVCPFLLHWKREIKISCPLVLVLDINNMKKKSFHCTSQVAQDYGCDVLDLHYFFRNKTEMRVGDGVHWNALAHRKITNIILAHVSKAWGVKLPGRDRRANMFSSPLELKVTVY